MSLIAGNLAVVQRLLDGANMPWGVFAGAAAHLYGNRRPIQDVDLLIMRGQLPQVVKLLQGSGKAVQFDGQRILWRGIKIFDDLTLRRAGQTYPLLLDEPMRQRLRRMPLLGAQVGVVAPEDVIAHKLLLGRGQAEGKHDQIDVEGIVRRQKLDHAYLIERARLLNAEVLLRERFAALGLEV
ncbi:nucleotidyltransferase family protein [Candidatus Viridilinea mediisalina]|uniref:Nucleotidyltransferase n=1 Tax=Candidatus Viridilinea mediisalina TaxID=2024553 RepID=A0A2A6RPL0_9CHLR|nr:nucleotidyltransferase family protein [Candidatus Viridilinea mediisalina]PDW04873.1 hypothetical protein CJ255_01310 [Candidatus Viridilinea mediisalina]